MSTSLFDSLIFGPVQSRRMGVSLGVNLLPSTEKFCNYDCVYCECGFTYTPSKNTRLLLPPRSEVYAQLKTKIISMNPKPNAITFAGNGEPTIHPEFCEIIDDVIEIRNEFCPSTEIVVLTNATQTHKPHIIKSLQKINRCMFKLDSGVESTFQKINQPLQSLNIQYFTKNIAQFPNCILQTLFVYGEHKGEIFDNTTDEEVDALISCYKQINPSEIVIYGIQRDTPINTISKVSKEKLEQIAGKIRKVGLKVSVSY